MFALVESTPAEWYNNVEGRKQKDMFLSISDPPYNTNHDVNNVGSFSLRSEATAIVERPAESNIKQKTTIRRQLNYLYHFEKL